MVRSPVTISMRPVPGFPTTATGGRPLLPEASVRATVWPPLVTLASNRIVNDLLQTRRKVALRNRVLRVLVSFHLRHSWGTSSTIPAIKTRWTGTGARTPSWPSSCLASGRGTLIFQMAIGPLFNPDGGNFAGVQRGGPLTGRPL